LLYLNILLTMLSIHDEFSPLKKVIIGSGKPYQRDKTQVATEMKEFPLVPNTDRKAEVLGMCYPGEEILVREYKDYVSTLVKHGVEVLFADTGAAYSFDYTCPRDIGFVIGGTFFVANMAVDSRSEEIRTIEHHLAAIPPEGIVRPPHNCLIEGGDVIVLDKDTVLVGYNRRTNPEGCAFLKDYLEQEGIRVIPVQHRQLHLDCCLNPLGKGHMLIHPDSLTESDNTTWRLLARYQWITVDDTEREYLATNVLSIDSNTIVARSHASCRRVNESLVKAGYRVEAVEFDGVPATGGSFRCASLPLSRRTP
jgi:N-dimethylarginine dimethylaminohydrolase